MLRSIGKQSGESVESVLRWQVATVVLARGSIEVATKVFSL